MIVFHEGLPGAGKSYEACLFHILPQLKEGRRVLTNIEGINHEKFSQLTGIPLSIVKEKLTCIDHADCRDDEQKYNLQKKDILELSGKDTLVVIDEIQDMFPSERHKLSVEWSKYIGSHRHDGLDIILMGQSFSDVHAFWRRRVQRKIVFTKQTAIGRDNNYKWEAFEATTAEKFKKITSGTRQYDKQYFGLYDSHTVGTKNTDVYKDKRVVIWNTPGFKYGIPALLVALFYAGSYLHDFFTPKTSVKQVTPQANVESKNATPTKITVRKSEAKKDEKPVEYLAIDVFDQLANKHRARLAGVLHTDKKLVAEVEILDSSFHRKDVFTADQLQQMGWKVTYSAAGLRLVKGNVEYLVRQWPVDSWGKVDDGTIASFDSRNNSSVYITQDSTDIQKTGASKAIFISHEPASRMQGGRYTGRN